MEEKQNKSNFDISKFSPNTRYAIQVDKMKGGIIDLVEDCFNKETDPEMQWKFFREQLTHYKREQILAYLETDAL